MRKNKSGISLLLVLFLIVSVIGMQPASIRAAEKPVFTAASYNLTYIKNGNEYDNISIIYVENMPKNGEFVKVSSSNKKVVKASAFEYSENGIELVAKKAGKATITAKIKAGTKTYTVKCSVVVRNYTNPVSSLKIGNKEYKSSVKSINHFSIKYKKNSKYKIAVKCNKNWQLQHIGYFEGNGYKTIQNNKTITVKKVNSYLVLSFYNGKTKGTESVRVEFTK